MVQITNKLRNIGIVYSDMKLYDKINESCDLLIIGASGVGKSSLLNKFFNNDKIVPTKMTGSQTSTTNVPMIINSGDSCKTLSINTKYKTSDEWKSTLYFLWENNLIEILKMLFPDCNIDFSDDDDEDNIIKEFITNQTCKFNDKIEDFKNIDTLTEEITNINKSKIMDNYGSGDITKNENDILNTIENHRGNIWLLMKAGDSNLTNPFFNKIINKIDVNKLTLIITHIDAWSDNRDDDDAAVREINTAKQGCIQSLQLDKILKFHVNSLIFTTTTKYKSLVEYDDYCNLNLYNINNKTNELSNMTNKIKEQLMDYAKMIIYKNNPYQQQLCNQYKILLKPIYDKIEQIYNHILSLKDDYIEEIDNHIDYNTHWKRMWAICKSTGKHNKFNDNIAEFIVNLLKKR